MVEEIVQFQKNWVTHGSEFTGVSSMAFRGDCRLKMHPVETEFDSTLIDVQAMSYIVAGPGTLGEIEGQPVVGRSYLDNTGAGGPPAGHETDILMYLNDSILPGMAHRHWNEPPFLRSATLRLHYAADGTDGILNDILGDPKPTLKVTHDFANVESDMVLGADRWYKNTTQLTIGGDASELDPIDFPPQFDPDVRFGDTNLEPLPGSGEINHRILTLDFTPIFSGMLDDIYRAEYYHRRENPEGPRIVPEMNLIIQAEQWTPPIDGTRNALYLGVNNGYPTSPYRAYIEVVYEKQFTPFKWQDGGTSP